MTEELSTALLKIPSSRESPQNDPPDTSWHSQLKLRGYVATLHAVTAVQSTLSGQCNENNWWNCFCFVSPHKKLAKAIGKTMQYLPQLPKCSCSSNKNYSQPVTLIQNHLNGLQEQQNMSGTDLKEQFNLVWATQVIRFYYTVQTQGHCWPFKMTCCPVKPRRGPAQRRIALNGISQHQHSTESASNTLTTVPLCSNSPISACILLCVCMREWVWDAGDRLRVHSVDKVSDMLWLQWNASRR